MRSPVLPTLRGFAGAETFSRILDWSDRTTCVLFGDGAGAMVLEARERIGGRVHTVRPPDSAQPIELGAEFIHGHSNALWPLIRSAGLPTQKVPERHELLREGVRVPFPDLQKTLQELLGPDPTRLPDRPFAELVDRSRAAGGDPVALDAVVNYVSHSLSPTIEPVANLCASGVLERFPKLRFATIEAGIGWLPWLLDAMDEAYRKHHMWAFPKLPKMPSEYFRSNGATTFQEDRVGLDLAVKYNLIDNFMWANDYPHHEGVWPHSAESIERQMGHLTEAQRALSSTA